MNKDTLLLYLKTQCRGKAHAISGDHLKQHVHTSENELRKAVNQMRREGIPIASDRIGYFYAENAGEVYSTIRRLKKMRAGLDAAIEGLEGSLCDFPLNRG